MKRRLQTVSGGDGVEKRETPMLCGECKLVSPDRHRYGGSLNN